MDGTAEAAAEDDPLLREFSSRRLLVRVRPQHVFPYRPRCIPNLAAGVLSPCAPRSGSVPPEPEWRGRAALRDAATARRA